ncbi:Soluble lytic murein transglycosylase precursor [Aquimixticola soesokkakensis]|uniref:Soluble lytic murein transglycosylase n=1 Tax=Aquimixticola soesokkakensis TaxID=1519096 RepID=A0A1Y5S5M9_9RHOB|nr:lytic transglycosylase domain-containing protein [Aquimixticola soesokkakensis]SLN32218.1 Soluble lytic murein transglycosylase precursor [Aquimixticola soesokkakensis]
MRQSILLFCAGFSVLLCVQGFAAFAQEVRVTPRPWPKVESKRIGVPSGPIGKRITVQITQEDAAKAAAAQAELHALMLEQAGLSSVDETAVTPLSPLAGPVPATPPLSGYEWYWAQVAHDLAGADAARFTQAVASLEGPEGQRVPVPRLADLAAIVDQYGADLLINSIDTQVSPALALAVIAVESAGKSDAASPVGAQGLMQLMPDTAARFDVSDATDASENIRAGITYLDWLLGEFNGDPVLALAGYNAGEGAVKKAGGVPPYAETRAYVPKVMAAWTVARGLCLTQPELYSDGCVFATSKDTVRN